MVILAQSEHGPHSRLKRPHNYSSNSLARLSSRGGGGVKVMKTAEQRFCLLITPLMSTVGWRLPQLVPTASQGPMGSPKATNGFLELAEKFSSNASADVAARIPTPE